MKLIPLLTAIVFFLWSCTGNNNGAGTAKTFCDTACNNDSFHFNGNHKWKPFVAISVKNCVADSLIWGNNHLEADRKMHMANLLGKQVRLNKSDINCFIKEADYAWLSFNDCLTGRGYLMKLPYEKKEDIQKMSSALNAFDKKFVVPDDLRAYADYSTIYVVDVNTNKTEQMSFKEELKINFDKVHEVIDSINVSHQRIYVLLNKNGQKVPMEKNINL